MYPICLYNYCPRVLNFIPFRSTTIPFRDTGHLVRSAPNEPKITMNHTRSIVPHIPVTSVHESQFSLHFALRPVAVKLQAKLRQVHRMTPNWPWTPQGQLPYICITSVPDSQISLYFALRTAVFKLQAVLRQVHRMTPKGLWTLQGHICPMYMLLVSTSAKFHSVSFYDQPFSICWPF